MHREARRDPGCKDRLLGNRHCRCGDGGRGYRGRRSCCGV